MDGELFDADEAAAIILTPGHLSWQDFLALRMHSLNESEGLNSSAQHSWLKREESVLEEQTISADRSAFLFKIDEEPVGYAMILLKEEQGQRELWIQEFYLKSERQEVKWQKYFIQALCQWGRSYGAVNYKVTVALPWLSAELRQGLLT